MSRQKIIVEGMSCNNCVRHVTEALKELQGVEHVEVSLEKNEATIQSQQPVEDAALRAALEESGYTFISSELL